MRLMQRFCFLWTKVCHVFNQVFFQGVKTSNFNSLKGIKNCLCAFKNRMVFAHTKKDYTQPRTFKAMTLLEAAIVLSIFGVIAVASVPILTQHLERTKRAALESRMQNAFEALAVYYLRYKRLPCPATTSDVNTSARCSANNVASRRGYLPYKELGLVKAQSLDLSGKPFLYFMHAKATRVLNQLDLSYPAEFRVLDLEGQEVVSDPEHHIVVVLVAQEDAQLGQQALSRYEQESLRLSPQFYDIPYMAASAPTPNRLKVGWRTLATLLGRQGLLALQMEESRSNLQTGISAQVMPGAQRRNTTPTTTSSSSSPLPSSLSSSPSFAPRGQIQQGQAPVRQSRERTSSGNPFDHPANRDSF